jgi:transposase
MSRKSAAVTLEETAIVRLEQWIRAGSTPQQVVVRAQIILEAARGQSDQATAEKLGIRRETAALWRRRVREQGIGCVWESEPGRGRKPRYGAATVKQWIDATLQTLPQGATHWSTRTLAQAQGVSKSTIHRVWQDHQIKPHLTKGFKLSRDPHFLEKLTDVVGVYLTPLQNAIVLCVDEKSQIQALDRTQPGLPLIPGRCGTYTHDYVRHGTTTLFAALHLVEGHVIGQYFPRHRHQEFLSHSQKGADPKGRSEGVRPIRRGQVADFDIPFDNQSLDEGPIRRGQVADFDIPFDNRSLDEATRSQRDQAASFSGEAC